MRHRRYQRIADPLLWILVLASLAPLVYMVLLAFLTQSSFISNRPLADGLWNSLTLQNFSTAIERTQFGQRVLVSLRLNGFVVLLVAILGLPAAHAISRLRSETGSEVAFAFLSVRMLPAVAVCIPIFYLFNRQGLAPPWVSLGLLQVGLNLPILVWLALPVFRSLPPELEELVIVDGLSPTRAFTLVVLPLLSRRLIGVVLIIAVLVWNETFFASIFGVQTVTEVIPSLITHRGVQWGLVMAVGTLVALPALLLLGGVLRLRWGLEGEEA